MSLTALIRGRLAREELKEANIDLMLSSLAVVDATCESLCLRRWCRLEQGKVASVAASRLQAALRGQEAKGRVKMMLAVREALVQAATRRSQALSMAASRLLGCFSTMHARRLIRGKREKEERVASRRLFASCLGMQVRRATSRLEMNHEIAASALRGGLLGMSARRRYEHLKNDFELASQRIQGLILGSEGRLLCKCIHQVTHEREKAAECLQAAAKAHLQRKSSVRLLASTRLQALTRSWTVRRNHGKSAVMSLEALSVSKLQAALKGHQERSALAARLRMEARVESLRVEEEALAMEAVMLSAMLAVKDAESQQKAAIEVIRGLGYGAVARRRVRGSRQKEVSVSLQRLLGAFQGYEARLIVDVMRVFHQKVTILQAWVRMYQVKSFFHGIDVSEVRVRYSVKAWRSYCRARQEKRESESRKLEQAHAFANGWSMAIAWRLWGTFYDDRRAISIRALEAVADAVWGPATVSRSFRQWREEYKQYTLIKRGVDEREDRLKRWVLYFLRGHARLLRREDRLERARLYRLALMWSRWEAHVSTMTREEEGVEMSVDATKLKVVMKWRRHTSEMCRAAEGAEEAMARWRSLHLESCFKQWTAVFTEESLEESRRDLANSSLRGARMEMCLRSWRGVVEGVRVEMALVMKGHWRALGYWRKKSPTLLLNSLRRWKLWSEAWTELVEIGERGLMRVAYRQWRRQHDSISTYLDALEEVLTGLLQGHLHRWRRVAQTKRKLRQTEIAQRWYMTRHLELGIERWLLLIEASSLRERRAQIVQDYVFAKDFWKKQKAWTLWSATSDEYGQRAVSYKCASLHKMRYAFWPWITSSTVRRHRAWTVTMGRAQILGKYLVRAWHQWRQVSIESSQESSALSYAKEVVRSSGLQWGLQELRSHLKAHPAWRRPASPASKRGVEYWARRRIEAAWLCFRSISKFEERRRHAPDVLLLHRAKVALGKMYASLEAQRCYDLVVAFGAQALVKRALRRWKTIFEEEIAVEELIGRGGLLRGMRRWKVAQVEAQSLKRAHARAKYACAHVPHASPASLITRVSLPGTTMALKGRGVVGKMACQYRREKKLREALRLWRGSSIGAQRAYTSHRASGAKKRAADLTVAFSLLSVEAGRYRRDQKGLRRIVHKERLLRQSAFDVWRRTVLAEVAADLVFHAGTRPKWMGYWRYLKSWRKSARRVVQRVLAMESGRKHHKRCGLVRWRSISKILSLQEDSELGKRAEEHQRRRCLAESVKRWTHQMELGLATEIVFERALASRARKACRVWSREALCIHLYRRDMKKASRSARERDSMQALSAWRRSLTNGVESELHLKRGELHRDVTTMCGCLFHWKEEAARMSMGKLASRGFKWEARPLKAWREEAGRWRRERYATGLWALLPRWCFERWVTRAHFLLEGQRGITSLLGGQAWEHWGKMARISRRERAGMMKARFHGQKRSIVGVYRRWRHSVRYFKTFLCAPPTYPLKAPSGKREIRKDVRKANKKAEKARSAREILEQDRRELTEVMISFSS